MKQASESQFQQALAVAARAHAEALDIALALPLTQALMQDVLRYRLPSMVAHKDFVEAGGLVSFSPSLSEGNRRVAAIVDKILRGAKPADLPIEQPTQFELVINPKTAKALGIAIPQSLVLRADAVIR